MKPRTQISAKMATVPPDLEKTADTLVTVARAIKTMRSHLHRSTLDNRLGVCDNSRVQFHTQQGATMPDLNKSEAVRDYFKSNPKATTQDVVDALAKQGITIAAGLVRNIKSKHNKRRSQESGQSRCQQPEVNKSQAIRDYYKSNPKAKTSEVIEALGKEGINVSANLVTTVKAKRKRRRAVKKAVEHVASQGVVGIPEIKAAFAYLKATGSVEIAKQALAAAIEIKKVV